MKAHASRLWRLTGAALKSGWLTHTSPCLYVIFTPAVSMFSSVLVLAKYHARYGETVRTLCLG